MGDGGVGIAEKGVAITRCRPHSRAPKPMAQCNGGHWGGGCQAWMSWHMLARGHGLDTSLKQKAPRSFGKTVRLPFAASLPFAGTKSVLNHSPSSNSLLSASGTELAHELEAFLSFWSGSPLWELAFRVPFAEISPVQLHGKKRCD